MSLEDALAANTAAIEKHTDALERFMKAAKSGAAPAAETKGEAKPAAKSQGKAAKPKKQPWDTHEDFIAYVGEYLKAGDTKENKQKIRNSVQPILDHFGASKFSEIEEEQREEACGYIKALADALASDGIDSIEGVDLGLANEDAGNDDLV